MPNMEKPILLNEKERTAVHLQRDAAQADFVARKVQMKEVADMVTEFIPDKEEMAQVVRSQMEYVLSRGTEQDKAMILARVPYICQDIKDINARGERIENALESIKVQMDAQKDILSTYPLVKSLVFGFVSMVLVSVVGGLLALVVIK